MTLLASMTLWSGVMEVLSASGDVNRLAAVMKRRARKLFGGVEDERCWEAMSVNLAANLLGLGNAATPAGVRAAQLLSEQGEAGLRGLAMLLALNNAGLQLAPTNVIALRHAAGSAAPGSVWGVSVAAAAASAAVSASVLLALQRGGKLG